MSDGRNHRTGGPAASMVNWTREPEFEFTTEVDALETLIELGEELRNAREQARQVMRYLGRAVVDARNQVGASPTAIINHSGLSRRTVYLLLDQE